MRVRISDKQALLSISPAQLMAYLRNKGARQVDEFPGKAAVWSYGDEELLVPLATRFADYAARMADILAVLEQKEERSQLQILHDLQYCDFDIIRVKISSEDSRNDSFNFVRCLDFIAKMRELLLAAACAAVTYKQHYTGRKPDKAIRFINNVRFGQTEQGSFVLQLLSPVTIKNERDSLYIKRVVPTLQYMLEHIDGAICKRLPFLESCLNTDIYNILVDMYDSVRDCCIGIEIAYSGMRKEKRPRYITQIDQLAISRTKEFIGKLSFENNMILDKEFPEASFVLPQAELWENEKLRIQGYVIGLYNDESKRKREVKIKAVSLASRLLLVELPDEDYSRAIMAHINRQLVELTGTVVKSGRTLRLIADSPLTIVEDNA